MMDSDALTKAIQSALTAETARIVEEEAKAAAKRVEERVRGETVRISTRLLQKFNMEMRGPTLCITVDFTETVMPFRPVPEVREFFPPAH